MLGSTPTARFSAWPQALFNGGRFARQSAKIEAEKAAYNKRQQELLPRVTSGPSSTHGTLPRTPESPRHTKH